MASDLGRVDRERRVKSSRGRGIEETTARKQTTLAGDLYIHVFMVRYDHAQTLLSLIPMIT